MNSKNKPNGHGALRAKGSGANGSTTSLSGMGRAASVDASELSVANAAASSAAAGTEREACADVAQVQGEGRRSPAAGNASRSDGEKNGSEEMSALTASRKIMPRLEPLPLDRGAFVDPVHPQAEPLQFGRG